MVFFGVCLVISTWAFSWYGAMVHSSSFLLSNACPPTHSVRTGWHRRRQCLAVRPDHAPLSWAVLYRMAQKTSVSGKEASPCPTVLSCSVLDGTEDISVRQLGLTIPHCPGLFLQPLVHVSPAVWSSSSVVLHPGAMCSMTLVSSPDVTPNG